jgi:hypothetical protein
MKRGEVKKETGRGGGSKFFALQTIILITGIILLFTNYSGATTRTSAINGSWNSPITWTPNGVPSITDDIVVATGNTVTVTSNQTVRNVTVNTGGVLKWSGSFKLTVTGSITVNGKVEMTGDLSLTTPGSAFVLGNNSTFTWKPVDNTLSGLTLFTNGIENFSSTSTLIIQRWYDYTVPLASNVSGNFGHLELNSLTNNNIYEWNQDNQFETHKILGTLTIDQGWITLDKSGTISNTTIGSITLMNGNSSFYGHHGNHASTFTITTSSATNNGGIFYGLNDGNGNITVHVTGNFVNLGNTKIITNSGMTNLANGNAIFIVDGTFSQNAGDTRILYNVTTANSGLFTATFNNLNLNGGIFMGQTGCRSSGGICSFSIRNDFTINFSSSADKFRITSLSSINNSMNNVEVAFNVGGTLHLNGNAVSEFTSTASAGKETVTIGEDFIVDGTDASLNYGTLQASHDNTLNVDGNIVINNGSTFLSRNNGLATITANGNLSITAGTLSLKGGTGNSIFNLAKNYTQSGGTFYLHHNNITPTTSSCAVNVMGDFTQSGGTFNYDNNALNTSATHTLNIKGSNYNISGGSLSHAGAGICNVFGQLNFAANGAVQFKRTGNAHLVTQVKQNVKAGCTLVVEAGNVQVSSHPTAGTNYFRIEAQGSLELRSSQIFSNSLFGNSGLQVDSSATLTTRHTSGLYNGTAQSAINANGNMNYFLHPSSIVEYCGNLPQLLTGIGNGIATGSQHKYGILRINFGGASKSVNVATANVFARTQLQLRKGELNLNSQTLTIENGNTNGIIRTNGYIKNALTMSGYICWKNITAGNHVFPFGVSPTEYIPVTFSPVSGMGNDVSISSYATQPDNWPYPIVGSTPITFRSETYCNSDVVDRWWMFRAIGVTADVTLTYLPQERTIAGEANAPLGIIQWNGSGWTTPSGSETLNTVRINHASAFSTWTLASKGNAVSFQLASFNAEQIDDVIYTKWITSSEYNSDHFVVERSADGIHYEEINTVKASGISSSPLHYSSIDRNPIKTTAYYRLKQTDTKGESKLSGVITVNYNDSKPANLEIENFGPNPFDNNFQITYRITKDGLVRFQFCSATGEVLYASQSNETKGSHRFDFKEEKPLTQGIYFIKIMYEDKVVTQKLIKK